MVQLCERDNETFAVRNFNTKGIFEVKGKRLIGVLGEAMDRLFIKFAKRR